MNQKDEEFYVGYRGLPPHTKRFLALRILPCVVLAPLVALLVAYLHEPYALGRSDFRDVRQFEGILLAKPAPHLVVPRPGRDNSFSRYLVVGRGKYGAKPEIIELGGQWVRLTGSLIYRAGTSVIAAKAVEKLEPPPRYDVGQLSQEEELGTFTLRGEIVDSKCHFGTMRPGEGKVHRGCAVRCIAGGVPPVFRVLDQNEQAMYFVLVSSNGQGIHEEVLDFVAEPLEITGQVFRQGDLFGLRADPKGYRRLSI